MFILIVFFGCYDIIVKSTLFSWFIVSTKSLFTNTSFFKVHLLYNHHKYSIEITYFTLMNICSIEYPHNRYPNILFEPERHILVITISNEFLKQIAAII